LAKKIEEKAKNGRKGQKWKKRPKIVEKAKNS
jgi:hypothetical protein